MASDKDKGTDILDDFDLDSDSLPDIEDDLLDDDSSIDIPSEAEEGELEQYGVWVKSEPETVEESLEEFTESSLSDLGNDLETSAEGEEEMLTQEEEELLSELEEHDGIEDEDIPPELPELGPEEADEEDEVEVALSDSTSIDEDFGGLGDIAGAGSSGDADRSAVLEKIEKELFEIKNELAELKKELTLLRKPAVRVVEEAGVDVQPVEAEAKGFFDEEEDETIALTGDELDNILNTADITEEVAEDTSLSVEEESSAITEELEIPTIEDDIEEFGGEISVGEELLELEGEEITLELPEEEGPEEIPLPIEAEDLLETEEVELPVMEELLDEAEDTTVAESPEVLAEEIAEELVDLETDEALPLLEEEEISLELPDLETEDAVETEEEPGVAESLQLEEPIELEELAAPEEPVEDVEEISLELPEEDIPEEDIEVDLGVAEGGVEEIPELGTEEGEELQLGPLDIEDELEALEELPSDEPADDAVDLTEAPVSEGEISAEEVEQAEEVDMGAVQTLPGSLRNDIKTVLSYMDQLLESLPEDKIEEFAKSEYFEVYRKLFEELGIVK